MPSWTDPLDLDTDRGLRWDFGVRVVWCELVRSQLRVGWHDPERDEPEDAALSLYEAPCGETPRVRAASDSPARVQLQVTPCPRSVVARPEVPLTVPPGGQASVLVGVPIWLSLMAGRVPVAELAAVRLSDTWFGEPTDGVLCYATRTHLRMQLDHIPRRPYRALCRIRIHNETDEAMVIERLCIPAPSLALYEGKGRLWTSDLAYTAMPGSDSARVTISEGAPSDASSAVERAQAREASPPLARVFNALWRSGL